MRAILSMGICAVIAGCPESLSDVDADERDAPVSDGGRLPLEDARAGDATAIDARDAHIESDPDAHLEVDAFVMDALEPDAAPGDAGRDAPSADAWSADATARDAGRDAPSVDAWRADARGTDAGRCVSALECPAATDACVVATCSALGRCGLRAAPDGSVCPRGTCDFGRCLEAAAVVVTPPTPTEFARFGEFVGETNRGFLVSDLTGSCTSGSCVVHRYDTATWLPVIAEFTPRVNLGSFPQAFAAGDAILAGNPPSGATPRAMLSASRGAADLSVNRPAGLRAFDGTYLWTVPAGGPPTFWSLSGSTYVVAGTLGTDPIPNLMMAVQPNRVLIRRGAALELYEPSAGGFILLATGAAPAGWRLEGAVGVRDDSVAAHVISEDRRDRAIAVFRRDASTLRSTSVHVHSANTIEVLPLEIRGSYVLGSGGVSGAGNPQYQVLVDVDRARVRYLYDGTALGVGYGTSSIALTTTHAVIGGVGRFWVYALE